MTAGKPITSRPPLRATLSIARGNLIQTAGLITGAALLTLAAAMTGPGPAQLASRCWDSWSSMTAVTPRPLPRRPCRGHPVPVLRDPRHRPPEDYPPGFRQLMSAMPFWSVVTDKTSMRATAPWKKALMFAAGETATAVCSITAAYAAMTAGIPGGQVLFLVTVAGTQSAPSSPPAHPRETTPRRCVPSGQLRRLRQPAEPRPPRTAAQTARPGGPHAPYRHS
jgi:hypothetical protein